MRKLLYYNNFRISVFFEKSFWVEKVRFLIYIL